MSIARTLLTAALMTAVVTPSASAQWKAQIEPGAVAVPRGDLFVRNLDAVWTANDTVHRNVSILIRDGAIRAIGSDLPAPRGVPVVDGSGLTAIPGLVDEHTHIGMRSTNEGSVPISAEVRVIDALDPEDFGIYRALSGGVTTAQVLHGSANPIGGQSAIIKMRWGMEDGRKLLVEGAPQTIKFALGENVTRKNFGGQGQQRFPASREGVEAVYVGAFSSAQEYKKTWDAYRANPRAFRVPPRRDLRLEALVDVMDGRILVTAHSYRSDEIVMLLRVAERFGFKINSFTHVLEGYKVADEIAAHGAGAGTFSDWWAYKLEAYDAIPYNAAIMYEHGVKTAINSDDTGSNLSSFMAYEFNKAVKYGGVPKEDALRMLTRYPAEILRIDDKVGTLQVGKQADMVLLSGDPFDAYSRVEKTIVDGIVYYDRLREAETRGDPVRPPPQTPVVPDAVSPSISPAPSQPDALTTERGAATRGPSAGIDLLGTPRQQGQVTALVGATVHPASRPPIESGVVLVASGRIQAVGSAGEVTIPDGATVINLAGKHLYPGMIDPMTQLGMVEIGQVAASRDDREVGRYNPHIRALTGVHPHSEAIPVARANGILTVLTAPASGVIRGMGSVIQLHGDTPERMAIRDSGALVVAFPSPKGDPWDEPSLEGDNLEELVTLFERAVLYAKGTATHDDPTARFDPNITNRHRFLVASLAPAVTGRIPVLFMVRRERDIRSLLLFLDKFPEIQAVVVGGDQAFRVAGELASRSIPVIVGSALSPTMDRDDPLTAGWENAAFLHAAGVRVAFATDDVSNVRNLPYHAAKAVAFGLPQDEALRAVTLNPAEILGLGSEMGSIDVGKRADLIVTDGDPLQIVTQVERAFIQGVEVSLETKHTRLYEAFRNRH
ncbi:MAG: amidohydrolase family protein [Gemmatimonadota bacterium]|nr:amidohydrolase family protein [Gemmatimonadota bacterium]MDH3367813.1 amidohydrolase family protein [Gemmatimonadota bacterium]